jgi:hypothetical protein
LSQEQGSDLLGARMVGRWKSVSCKQSCYSTTAHLISILFTGCTGLSVAHVRRPRSRPGLQP